MTTMPPASQRSRGLPLVLLSSVVAAAGSFLVLLLVAPAVGPAGYAQFSVFWAAVFMVIGVLFGIQQESTRAVAAPPGSMHAGSTNLFVFAGVIGGGLFILCLASGFWWSEPLFGSNGTAFVLPLAVGVSTYAMVAALNGVLAGRRNWTAFAVLPLIDSGLRLFLVILVLRANLGGSALAWAVVIPFPISLLITWYFGRKTTQHHGRVPLNARALSVNVARTFLASASTAVLINGFPVVLSLLGRADTDELGAITLALMLTRAPILVPLTAAQSMMITRLSNRPEGRLRFVLVAIAALAIATFTLVMAANFWGEQLVVSFFGSGYALNGAMLGGLVAASGCLGLLTITGSLALGLGLHNSFAAGWMLAAGVSVFAFALLPCDLGSRTTLSLALGPLLGSIWHLAASYMRFRSQKLTPGNAASD